ncbi:MAG: DUF4760 domain-containing protein [Syntrophales bacterium]
MSAVDIAQIVVAASAAIGLFLVWWQVRKQTTQHFSGRILDLYHELDTNQTRDERRFVYTEFPTIKNPTKEQIDRVRDALASMDRMAYQVIRGYADPRAAHDLYGRVLTRIVFSAWKWMQEERRWRNDPPPFHYCRFAEQLALKYAREDLKAMGLWKYSHRKLPPHELLQKAVEWSSPATLTALESQEQDTK